MNCFRRQAPFHFSNDNRLPVLLFTAAGLLLLLLGACRQTPTPTATETPTLTPSPTPSPSPTPTPDPAAMLRQAAEAMQALETVHFTISNSGGPVYFDPDQTLVFRSAAGDYAAPDAIQAVVDVQGPGLNLQLSTIAIGEQQWISNPLTQRWEQLPPGWGFNPAVLFDPTVGWQRLLADDVVGVAPLESATLDGTEYHLIQATLAGERVGAMSGGLAPEQELEVNFWIDQETWRIVQIGFGTVASDGQTSDWLVTFSDFNAPVTIAPPPGS